MPAGAVAGPGLPTLSYNWSGYAVTSSQPFNYVHSQFVQPTVSCTGAHNRWTANWVGFDGFNNGTVEQDGTFAHCGGPKAATPIYEAWYEMYPNPSVFVFPVHAGDVMDTTASYAGGKFTLTVSDLSSGRTSSNVAVCGVCTRSSAEWIVERPALCNSAFCYITALADFRTTTMTGDVAGVAGGTAKPVSAFTNYAIFMVQPLSKGFISLDNVGPFPPGLGRVYHHLVPGRRNRAPVLTLGRGAQRPSQSVDEPVPGSRLSSVSQTRHRGGPMGSTTGASVQSGTIEELARTVSQEEQLATIRSVGTSFDSIFSWDYEKGKRQALNKLYEKAKTSQWNAETDIDWSVTGQIDAARDPANPLNTMAATDEGPFGRLNAEERARLGHASMAWTLSQFMHGEQGALLCTAKIVDSVPWMDAKYYAATQVMDEARHVEVYAKYLREKLEWEFPVNVHLRELLDDVLPILAGTSPIWACRSWSRGWPWPHSAFNTSSAPTRCSNRSPATSCPTKPATWPSGYFRSRRPTSSSVGRRYESARSSATRRRCGCGTGS